MVNIIIVTHGDFGAYIAEAAENIAGQQNEGVKNISVSQKMSLEDVTQKVEKAAKEYYVQDGLIFLTDMPGGTPMNVSLPIAAKMENTAVICGLNLSMAVSAFANRKNLSFEELVEKIQTDGKRAICEVKKLLNKN
ncbi:MAG: PTS sugar transporter subunit IIA [Elusimicrobia bacterium]|nr:PTS sugar transporter subunit IIA [Elusimicrobiota bacterium]